MAVFDRRLQDDDFEGADDSSGSGPPLRSTDKQSSERRDRPVATQCQLYLIKLPLGPAPEAEPNVGLMAEIVSTPVGADRLLTLHC